MVGSPFQSYSSYAKAQEHDQLFARLGIHRRRIHQQVMKQIFMINHSAGYQSAFLPSAQDPFDPAAKR